MKKQNLFINEELEWLEQRLLEIRAYIDEHPLSQLEDRIDYKETKSGGMMRTVIATREQQLKAYVDTLEKVPKLLEALNTLRERAEKEKLARGGKVVGSFMNDELNDQS